MPSQFCKVTLNVEGTGVHLKGSGGKEWSLEIDKIDPPGIFTSSDIFISIRHATADVLLLSLSINTSHSPEEVRPFPILFLPFIEDITVTCGVFLVRLFG